jgi:dihydroneopterin aldolase
MLRAVPSTTRIALSTLVVEEGTKASYKLLETLAQQLLARIFADTPALSATIRLRKFGAPTTASVDSAAIEVAGAKRV